MYGVVKHNHEAAVKNQVLCLWPWVCTRWLFWAGEMKKNFLMVDRSAKKVRAYQWVFCMLVSETSKFVSASSTSAFCTFSSSSSLAVLLHSVEADTSSCWAQSIGGVEHRWSGGISWPAQSLRLPKWTSEALRWHVEVTPETWRFPQILSRLAVVAALWIAAFRHRLG